MKRLNLLFIALLAISITSCGNRETQKDEDEIQLEEQDNISTQYEKAIVDEMPSADDQNEINEAKGVINDYYGALGRSQPRDAYDLMDPGSNRGSFSEFSEKQSKYENIEVSFTDEKPTVSDMGNNYSVKIPIRYTGTTAQGNQETYSGTAELMKQKTDDGEYRITSLNVKREDS